MADKKITQFTEATEIVNADLLTAVASPFGVGSNRKITLENFKKAIPKGPTFIVGLGDNVDFSDIQDAIDALPAEGGQILIKNGVYNLTSGLVLAKSNVLIQGESLGAILTVDSAQSFYMLTIGASGQTYENIKISGLQFDGQIGEFASNPNGIVMTGTINNYEISNCYFKDIDNYPLYDTTRGVHKVFFGNYIQGCYSGPTISYGLDVRIDNNTIKGNIQNGFISDFVIGIVITNNIIDGITSAAGFPYALKCNGCGQVTISNNTFKDVTSYGMYVGQCLNVQINNNCFTNCTSAPFQVFNCRYGAINSNNIYKCVFGVYFSGTKDFNLVGNTSISTQTTGIIISNCENISATGNTVRDFSPEGMSEYFGISIEGGSKHCAVVGNTVYMTDDIERRFAISEYGNGADYNCIAHNIVRGKFYKHIYAFGRNSQVSENILHYV